MKPKITAKIKKDKQGEGLWLKIKNGNLPEYKVPISEEKVEPIALACTEWIIKSGKKEGLLGGKKA